MADRGPHSEVVGVVGAGLMGCGIAAVCALAGASTTVVDVDRSRLEDITDFVDNVERELREAGFAVQCPGAASSIAVDTSIAALSSASLVFEAVPERIDLKHHVYEALEIALSGSAVIASTTSSFVPADLSRRFQRPERFLVAHFWNPPHAINLVEVVPSIQTSANVTEEVVTFLRSISQQPVIVKRQVPGFIGNRLQFALLREALHLVQTGVASAADVDAVVRLTLGPRYSQTGPLESADLAGLDTFLNIAEHLMPSLAKSEAPLELLAAFVEAGQFGTRTGSGFYHWHGDRTAEVIATRNSALLAHRLRRMTAVS